MDLHGFNVLDLILGAIIIISLLVGIARGLMREILSLFAWVIALWIAWKFANQLSEKLVQQFIADTHIAYIASFGVLFLVALFAIGLLNLLLASIFNATGLTGFDRLLGALFGLTRGAIICSVIVFFAQLYPNIDQEPWWRESKLTPGFVNIANWGISKLPANVRAQAEASLNSNNVGVLINTPNALTPHDATTSPNNTDAARPQTDTSAQTTQGNALSNMGAPIKLESMSDDSTVDQNTDQIQPDSDEPNTAPSANDIPAAPVLELESTQ